MSSVTLAIFVLTLCLECNATSTHKSNGTRAMLQVKEHRTATTVAHEGLFWARQLPTRLIGFITTISLCLAVPEWSECLDVVPFLTGALLVARSNKSISYGARKLLANCDFKRGGAMCFEGGSCANNETELQ